MKKKDNKAFYTTILFIFLFVTFKSPAQQVSGAIQLNQVGFYTGAPKVAVVTGKVPAETFYITTTNNRDTVFSGTLGPQRTSAYSATQTRIADFSALQVPGSYILLIPNFGHSYVFQVNDYVHRAVAIASLKGFYFQRSNMPMLQPFAGRWHRSAGHPDTAVLVHPSAASTKRPAGTMLSSPGGWYDAGDYNKYIVNSGITTATLLSAYEDFASYFDTLYTNIPESDDAMPDLLNEALYNLHWMLTMQDEDGGVYHKLTNADFDGMVLPGITKAARYVVQKSTAAALNFAAVMAQAARIFKKYEKQVPGFSATANNAAVKAWQWAQSNPNAAYNQNVNNTKFKPAITTGEYGDTNFKDEWLWAAAELFATTQNKKYFDLVAQQMKVSTSLPSWSNTGLLGYYTLVRHHRHLPAFAAAVVKNAKDSVVQMANRFISNGGNQAFQTIMGQSARDFIWGSSAVAANQGIVLINAYLIAKDEKYISHALTNLDYILGRNATGYCFVTGTGSKSPMHPHHRPSVADGITEPVPGLLAGGPNPGRQDKCTYAFTETETSYTDHDCSYASNEIAINWNAPLVYLANAIEALQQEAGYNKPVKPSNKKAL